MADGVHIFGVRHHGPGSARSLVHALNELKPACILVEGPPDADEMIPLAADSQMQPPIAILVHASDEPSRAVYYPFATFSPEWNAIRWGLEHKSSIRFMDLPQAHRMPIEMEQEKQAQNASASAEASGSTNSSAIFDPIGELARTAGFDDGERWWEYLVEHRQEQAGIFEALRDAMAVLRERAPSPDRHEAHREAWMRRTIRETRAEGFTKIAAVCGAWHAPALDVDAVTKKQDDDLLKGLPKLKTSATWIPWTYDHLTFASGYGAGVYSPGWYEHIWKSDRTCLLESWMTRVARLLREKDIDCSSAHVIEAVRLAGLLASLRSRPLADLSDIADATRAVFCFDSDLPMHLIARDLLVGIRMGSVPESTPAVPLVQDLQKNQKRLRLKLEALEKVLDLDLREETDRQRSQLLHRLRLLGIDWGVPQPQPNRGKGTFHEIWQLRWDPGFTIQLIEAGVLGNTIEQAAFGKLRKLATESSDLRVLASLLQDALLADLGDAVAELVQKIEGVSAISADVSLLMQTLPRLAAVLRYGNVRQADESMVRQIINGVVPRITIGLGGAVSSLNDDAAVAMEQNIRATSSAIEMVESAEHSYVWFECLARIIDQDTIHGLVRGRCTRILLDAGKIDSTEVARRLGLALSRGADPAHTARWIEGFLTGSGLLLIHDARLLGVIDQWVTEIQPEIFDELIPLLRRTFSTFPRPERHQIGQMLSTGKSLQATGAVDDSIDHDRAAMALPLLLQILGGRQQ
ncbi:MAG TPA: DUF5682 family protein [Tepidisphaeraceae bacterium]|nr:DUF5682 family protein [Tepidisphaeraceae bacterium]